MSQYSTTKQELNDFLTKFPWKNDLLDLGTPLHFLWKFNLPASTEELWPYLSDTSTFNEKMGLPKMTYTEKDGRLFGTSKNIGMTLEWEEIPWQWVENKQLTSARDYSKGFGRYVRAIYVLEKISGHETLLWVYFGWIPRNFYGKLLLKAGIPQLGKLYRQTLDDILNLVLQNRETNAIGATPAPLVEVNESLLSEKGATRLATKVSNLRGQPLDFAHLDKLLELIKSSHDNKVDRIRVKELASLWNIDFRELLPVFLYATREGILTLSWDIICPHCQGARDSVPNLTDVPTHGSCEPCGIDFDATGINALEVTFHIHPSIRRVEKRMYCAAEPAKKNHIMVQQTVQVGQNRKTMLGFDSGRYRMRVQGRQVYNILDVEKEIPGSESTDTPIEWSASYAGENYTREAQDGIVTIAFKNDSDIEATFVIEKDESDTLALRPIDLFALQEFRDLFSDQSIAVDTQLDIGVQTILFTDIVGSTRFYQEQGDTGAYAKVRIHFNQAHRIVAEHSGTIVKTIGDAIMSAFASPADAFQAALDLQSLFSLQNNDIYFELRYSLHTGPCLAVNLNSRIDYFGNTVNFAAKLQSKADSSQIAFSEAVFTDKGVRRILKELGRPIAKVPFKQNWDGRTTSVYRIKAATLEPALV